MDFASTDMALKYPCARFGHGIIRVRYRLSVADQFGIPCSIFDTGYSTTSEWSAGFRLLLCDLDLEGLQASARPRRAPRGHQVASRGARHVVETE